MGDQLVREGSPPANQLAAPIPQYRLEGTPDQYEPVQGSDGAPKMQAEAGKIADLATLLTAFNNEDFAQDARLELVREVLNTINGKVATEAKQDTIISELQSLDSTDFSTDTKLELVRLLLVSIDSKVATETTLAEIKAELETIKTDIQALKNGLVEVE